MCGNKLITVTYKAGIIYSIPLLKNSTMKNKYYGNYKTHATEYSLWEFFNYQDVINN